MKSAILAAMLLAASSGTSFATDTTAKAPPASPPPIDNWTGFYVGGNVGSGWGGHSDVAGNAATDNGPTIPAAFAGSRGQQLNGLLGGAQIGYNYHVSPQWVLGWEADIQASGQRGSDSFSTPFTGTTCDRFNCYLVSGTAATSDPRIEWFGTVRGRVGVLITPDLLLFGTGGLAYGGVVPGSVNVGATGYISGIGYVNPEVGASFGPTTSALGQRRTNIGFAVGGGLEGRLPESLAANWTWKLEYMYVDLGSLDSSTAFNAASSNPGNWTNLIGTVSEHAHFTDNVVRVGLNYHFN